MISGTNIRGVSFRRWMAKEPSVSRFYILESMRTIRVKPRFTGIRIRESLWNECLHTREKLHREMGLRHGSNSHSLENMSSTASDTPT